MDERMQVIDRLRALELDGGSHENLSAIARAILPDATFGWTVGACERLRDTLVALIGGETMAVVRDGITDELRKYATVSWDPWPEARDRLLQMCDRIDAEHERACKDAHEEDYSYSDGFDDGLCAQVSGMSDERLADIGLVRLPVDADGEVIRVGYELEGSNGQHYVVDVLELHRKGWTAAEYGTSKHLQKLDDWRIHKPTIEDVLREFAGRVCNSGHQWGLDADATIAEYAKRLRLAGED